MKSIAVILAGGKGSRLSAANEKQFIKVNDYTILEHTLKKFLKIYKKKSILIVVPHSKINKKSLILYNKYTEHDFIIGGFTRKQSVKNSIEYIKTLNKIPENILIHDAARPNTSIRLLNKIKKNIHKKNVNFVIPYLNIDSTLKKKIGNKVSTQNREVFFMTQTPQAFKFIKVAELYSLNDKITDDAQLIEIYKINNGMYIKGEIENIKITNQGDVELFKKLNNHDISFKVGNGFDVHKLVPGDGIMLGGIKIKSDKKLAGHSDGDVILHALCDSILGAISMKDIGTMFPSSDKELKDSDSSIFLSRIMEILNATSYTVSNIDVTIICQSPSLKNHKDKIKKNIMKLTKLKNNQLNIKAKTTDYLGLIGNSKAISCWITTTIKK
tara:strand:- start:1019 stop:2170 length:1152 start_codon:yes stop_codon:yes gene_type:complete